MTKETTLDEIYLIIGASICMAVFIALGVFA